MTVTRDSFVAVFPEFNVPDKYPADAIDFWLDQAFDIFPADHLGKRADLIAMLYLAHNLTLGVVSGAGGGSAGAFAPTTSKAVGSVSKSMDVASILSAGAGIWNTTAYGQRLYALLRGFVAGGVYRPSARAAAIAAAQGYPYGRL